MEILNQYMNVRIITLFFFIIINVYAYNFYILNLSLLYFTFIHFHELLINVYDNGNDIGKDEFIFCFSSDVLEYQEIDYNFDIGNYFVNVMVDNTPILFVFTIIYDEELGFNYLCTNKISCNYKDTTISTSSTSLIHFKCKYNKISVLPDKESVISITIHEI
jgi:hypothetical protein